MSRTVTPSQVQQPATGSVKIAHDKIAMRAYEKWVKRGRPRGNNPEQDWFEAEAELRVETTRSHPADGNRSHPAPATSQAAAPQHSSGTSPNQGRR